MRTGEHYRKLHGFTVSARVAFRLYPGFAENLANLSYFVVCRA